MGRLVKGDLVLNTNEFSNNDCKFGIFISYRKNSAFQENKTLSKILLNTEIVQIPTGFLEKITKEGK